MSETMPSAAALSAQNLARRCAICGEPAQVFRIGSDAQYTTRTVDSAHGTRTRRVLSARAVASVDLCLAHGLQHWPWSSQKVRRRRVPR